MKDAKLVPLTSDGVPVHVGMKLYFWDKNKLRWDSEKVAFYCIGPGGNGSVFNDAGDTLNMDLWYSKPQGPYK